MTEPASPRQLVVIDAPSNLGLRPPAPGKEPGVKRLAATLRRHGLVERLGALDGGQVTPAPYSFDLDPAIGVRNLSGIRQFALDLADHLTPLIGRGQVPVVLGGDCSILLGPMLALRRRGRFGLVFIDGHHDLLLPATSQTGGVAGMDLALVLGYGPPALSNPGALGPLVRPEDVALLGPRSGRPDDQVMRELLAHRIGLALSLTELRRLGATATADQALVAVAKHTATGFWIHLDADVLDHAVMPAVDSPQPGGLHYDELVTILRRLLASRRVAGITITIYDPDLDPDGTIAEAFVDALTQGLAAEAATG